jgi:hypothetical protein
MVLISPKLWDICKEDDRSSGDERANVTLRQKRPVKNVFVPIPPACAKLEMEVYDTGCALLLARQACLSSCLSRTIEIVRRSNQNLTIS